MSASISRRLRRRPENNVNDENKSCTSFSVQKMNKTETDADCSNIKKRSKRKKAQVEVTNTETELRSTESEGNGIKISRKRQPNYLAFEENMNFNECEVDEHPQENKIRKKKKRKAPKTATSLNLKNETSDSDGNKNRLSREQEPNISATIEDNMNHDCEISSVLSMEKESENSQHKIRIKKKKTPETSINLNNETSDSDDKQELRKLELQELNEVVIRSKKGGKIKRKKKKHYKIQEIVDDVKEYMEESPNSSLPATGESEVEIISTTKFVLDKKPEIIDLQVSLTDKVAENVLDCIENHSFNTSESKKHRSFDFHSNLEETNKIFDIDNKENTDVGNSRRDTYDLHQSVTEMELLKRESRKLTRKSVCFNISADKPRRIRRNTYDLDEIAADAPVLKSCATPDKKWEPAIVGSAKKIINKSSCELPLPAKNCNEIIVSRPVSSTNRRVTFQGASFVSQKSNRSSTGNASTICRLDGSKTRKSHNGTLSTTKTYGVKKSDVETDSFSKRNEETSFNATLPRRSARKSTPNNNSLTVIDLVTPLVKPKLERSSTFTKNSTEKDVIVAKELDETFTLKDDEDEPHDTSEKPDFSKVTNRRKLDRKDSMGHDKDTLSLLQNSLELDNVTAPWENMLDDVEQTFEPTTKKISPKKCDGSMIAKNNVQDTDKSECTLKMATPSVIRRTKLIITSPPSSTSTPFSNRKVNYILKKVPTKEKSSVSIDGGKSANKSTDKKIKRTKLPNFALIHQKAYEKLEDIREMSQRKAERAKFLLSGHKPDNNNSMIKKKSVVSSSKKQLHFDSGCSNAIDAITTTALPLTPIPNRLFRINKISPVNAKSSPRMKEILKASPCRPTVSSKENFKMTPIEKKVALLKGKTTLPKATKTLPQKEGYTRYGFKINTSTSITKSEEMKAVVNKSKVPTNTVEKRRNLIQGVRSNRRFELLMAMRNKT